MPCKGKSLKTVAKKIKSKSSKYTWKEAYGVATRIKSGRSR